MRRDHEFCPEDRMLIALTDASDFSNESAPVHTVFPYKNQIEKNICVSDRSHRWISAHTTIAAMMSTAAVCAQYLMWNGRGY